MKMLATILTASACVATPTFADFHNAPPPPPFMGGVFECSVVSQQPPDGNDRDPVYKINVNVELENFGAGYATSFKSMGVVHTVRSGREYDRSNQYTDGARIWQTTGKMEWNWTGWWRGNFQMIGTIYHNDRDGWTYRETQFKDNHLQYMMLADCHLATFPDARGE